MAPVLLLSPTVSDRYRVMLGKSGEDLACRELARRGYEILERRYRTRLGEIDIVARQGDVLVFVEVKTRAGTAHGMPVEAVTAPKRARLVAMAERYLASRRVRASACRFDVVAVSVERGRRRVLVVPGAFDASR